MVWMKGRRQGKRRKYQKGEPHHAVRLFIVKETAASSRAQRRGDKQKVFTELMDDGNREITFPNPYYGK